MIDSSSFFCQNKCMQIIISSAKQIKMKDDYCFEPSVPLFLNQANQLLTVMQAMNPAVLKKVLKCSDQIANKTFNTYQNFNQNPITTPAILAYSGIQYQYMASDVFTDDEMAFIQNHLWILSAFYGALRPLDPIQPHRLEMQSRPGFSMYEFWGDIPAKTIPDGPILNLASEEYARCIRPYRKLIDARFCQDIGGKLIEKGVYVKMARGRMVRYIAEHQIHTISDIQYFHDLNYTFSVKDSTENLYVFVQRKK